MKIRKRDWIGIISSILGVGSLLVGVILYAFDISYKVVSFCFFISIISIFIFVLFVMFIDKAKLKDIKNIVKR